MLNSPKFNPAQPDPGPNPLDSGVADIKKALEAAKDILILIRDNPRLDQVAAGLGLYLSLKDSGKSVTIASPTEMRVEFNRLVGVDKVSSKIGNRNLVVSFPQDIKDSIEKVSYNLDDGNFNLVIQPKAGYPALDSSRLIYSYSGAEAQLVFAIGAQKLEDLGRFYQEERKLFEQATVVNLDANPANTRFGQVNLIWADFTSCSEIVTELIERLGLKLDADTATNLLSGMNEATQNFQRFNLKATTFEAAAKLMKAGGKRPIGVPPTPMASRQFGAPFTPSPSGNFPSPFNQAPISSYPAQPPAPAPSPLTHTFPPAPQPMPLNRAPAFEEPPLNTPPQSLPANPLGPIPTDSFPSAATNPSDDQQTDWLKPKIFTGSSKIS